MISSDFRAEARRKLTGKLGKAVCIVLAYFVIFFLIGFLEGLFPDSMKGIFTIITTIIEIPISLGLIYVFLKLYKNEDVKAFDFLQFGFSNFGKSWGITFQIILKMLVPVILIIVSYVFIIIGAVSTSISYITYDLNGNFVLLTVIGFILFIISMIWAIPKSYYYQLAYLIAIENPEMSSKDVVEKSSQLMTGNRGKLFCLQFSFIGWALLASFTFGIGFLCLIPYIQFASIAFYKHVNGDNSDIEVKIEENTSSDDNNPIK